MLVNGSRHDVQAFLFDKDGTLVSFDHWIWVMRERARRLAPQFDLSAAQADSLSRFLGLDPVTGNALPSGLIPLPRSDTEAAVAEWFTQNGGVPFAEVAKVVAEVFTEVDQEFPFERYIQPTPGAEEALLGIRRAGGKVGVVTSDAAAAARRHFVALGWDELIDVIVGIDVHPERKPAPGPVVAACSLLGINPVAGVMVGDTATDLQAGKSAGCRLTIGVLTGIGRPEDLGEADLILPNLVELKIA
jgi:phosphoglycolate phosphatase